MHSLTFNTFELRSEFLDEVEPHTPVDNSHVIELEDDEVGDDNSTSKAVGPQAIVHFFAAIPLFHLFSC